MTAPQGGLPAPGILQEERPSGVSLPVYINRLIWLCMLPLLLLAVYLAVDHVVAHRSEVDRQADSLGKGISSAIDQHLSARVAGLQMLAASPLVDDVHRYSDLYKSAESFRQGFGSEVVLADAALNVLFNTREAFGISQMPLPQPSGKSAVEHARKSQMPAVGDIFFGPVAKQNLVAIAVPVVRQGDVRLFLIAPFETRQFHGRLEDFQLPPGWTVTLRDSGGDVVARRVSVDGDVSTEAEPPRLYPFRLSLAPWAVEVEISQAAYRTPIVQSIAFLFGTIALAMVCTLTGGTWVSRRLVCAVASLAQEGPVPGQMSDIAEITAVRRMLGQARLARDLAEVTLKVSIERFQSLYQDAPLPLAIVRLDGTALNTNHRFAQVFGYDPSDIPTFSDWWRHACSDALQRQWVSNSWNASVEQARRTHTDIAPAEYTVMCKNGDLRMVTISGTVLGDEILITFFDITDRKKSELRFQLVMEATRDGLWDMNLQTGKVFLAQRFCEMTGYPPGEISPGPDFLKRVVHPDDWARVVATNQAHLSGQTPVSAFEFRMVTAKGGVKWMECRGKVVEKDDAAKPVRMLGVITDIGKRKEAEEARQQSDAFVTSVLDSVASHIAVIDRKGYIVATNAPWEAFARANAPVAGEAAPRTGVGVNYLQVCEGDGFDHPDEGMPARIGIQGVLNGAQPSFSLEYPCHSPDTQRWFQMYVTPLVAAARGAVIVHTDITASKSAEIERKRADALAGRLAIFAEAAVNYAFIMLNAAADIVEWSAGAEFLMLFTRKQALGRPFHSLFATRCQAGGLPRDWIQRAMARGHVAVRESMLRADGAEFMGAGTLYGLPQSNGDTSFALVLSDVTASERAALLVAESEARLSAVVAGASDAIVSTDVTGVVQLFNPAAERIFQVPPGEIMGKSLDRLIPGLVPGQHRQHIADFAASGETRRAMGAGKVEGQRADGQRIELEASISKAVVGGHMVLTAILRDVTGRTRAERALVQNQVELAGLTHRLLAQEKDTTQRLAQALHDELGQTLAALRLIFDARSASMMADASLRAWSVRLDGLIHDANRQARQVLTDLRPPLLDELGLFAAVDNEMKQRQLDHEGIVFRLDWDVAAEELRWRSEVEYAAFMVAREAIGNALLHAAPNEIQVGVAGDSLHLLLTVRDSGRGMADLDKLHSSGHLGLVGMRERAIAIGARLDIHSSPETGTRISLQWSATP